MDAPARENLIETLTGRHDPVEPYKTMKKNIVGIAADRLARTGFLTAKRLYWQLRPVAPNDRRRVFVAGVQRSGTNMLMDILEKSWATDAYHERDERAFDNYKMRELPVIESLVAHSPAPVFVIKSLFELQDLPRLMEHFRPSKTVWIVRSYHDTVNSTLKSFRTNLVERVNRAVKPGCTEWLGAGMSPETRSKIQPFVSSRMRAEDAAAIQWYIRNVLFFEMEFDTNTAVLPVSYEMLVTQPDAQIQRICRFIEIPFAPRLSRGIFSSSIGKRRKPEISPEIEALCSRLLQRFHSLIH